ncbi:hypothetical protein [Helicobacter bilis]|uniref:hypothetical protein n=1 Tax=Helicobacter bilis TaxID=37372 RepID=UPI000CF0FB4D|nr:hypothetical protein [Helicobacter bilis]
MTLIITNVKQAFVEKFRDLAKETHADIEVCESEKELLNALEYTENGYTKEFEKEVLQELKDIETQRQNNTLKTYNNVKEAFKSEGII